MNRLEMAEEIANHVAVLAECDKDKWKTSENKRAEFVSDYPVNRILSFEIDEYVIGKGPQNRSFCYRIEREMDTLGRILGSTAFKFGVYFGRTKSDSTEEYRCRPHWGATPDEAFSAVKQAIADLLGAAAAGDSAGIAENPLSPMLKGKLLFLYHPNQFAPIYSEEHLEHFISELDLAGSFNGGPDMQRALMDCRLYHKELLKHFNPSEIAVVISNTGKEAGEKLYNELKDFNLEPGELKALLKRFKKRITPEVTVHSLGAQRSERLIEIN
jgi:hypothetical protein